MFLFQKTAAVRNVGVAYHKFKLFVGFCQGFKNITLDRLCGSTHYRTKFHCDSLNGCGENNF